MKHLKPSLLLLTIAITLTSCFESVISYNDKIITPMNTIAVQIDRFETASSEEDFKKIIDNIVINAEKGIKITSELEGYNGDTDFRDSAKDYYESCKNLFKSKDITKNIMMSYLDSMDIETTLSDGYMSFVDELNKLIELEDNIALAQERFAEENNMELE